MIKLIQDIFYKMGIIIKLVRPENNKWLQKRNLGYVLDIGANTGQYANLIHKILPNAKIISFEPIKGCYEQLVENTKGINVKAINCAIGDVNEQQEINISAHTPSSSLLPMANLHTEVFAGTDYVKKETITVKRLDDVFPQLKINGKFMVKVDVQGFEDRVIKGGIETLKKADSILIETSFEELYKDQLLFDGIYQLLINIGYAFQGNYTQTFNKEDGRILYAESFFVNTAKN
ncbi:FkbM family methyltransferase [Pedobacter sp. SD-b]|uniref:FkbM family methyltransferase n=1 Tax=Pedobacter segetis TaxID=2793069 RepID=A0ABS1BHG0_9SPHI|nr:FkbM family methyltransferase [Pedobacter segetis]MBK0382257.1 FkbM family methyltransferase [Pedobacter segetis]